MITLTGGPDALKTSLGDYQKAWKAFVVINHLESFEQTLLPIAISWKVEHMVALYGNLRLIGKQATQIHIGTVDDRFIAMAVLRKPYAGAEIIKIMERRTGSHDRLGLDSIDYYIPDLEQTYELLKSTGAKVSHEENDTHHWLSLRFGQNHEYEAKFINHSLLDVAISDLETAKNSLET